MYPVRPTTEPLPALLQRYSELMGRAIDYESHLRLHNAFHSLAIEGCLLSLSEMDILLGKGLAADRKPLMDHLMVLDQIDAFDYMLAMARRREPLSRTGLQQLAATVMKQTGQIIRTLTTSIDTSQGDLRTVEIIKANRTAINAHKLPVALDALLKEVNTGLDGARTIRQIYDLSFRVHYRLLSLQPFGAGNGQVARLVMNYVQHYHALPLSMVDSIARPAYVASLVKSRRAGNDQDFMRFMHDQLASFLRQEIERFLYFTS